MINIEDDNEEIKEEKTDNNVDDNTNENTEETKEENNDEDTNEITEEDALESLNKMLEEKDTEAKKYQDQYMRTLAEYDNFRKRTQKEKCDMYDKGIMETVGSFLEVIDNFDRALIGINKDELDEKSKQVVDGIEMIRGQMDKALNKIGVTAIDAKGKEFDPNIHNAVMHVDDENLGENIVAEELQRGYMYNDKVIRFSMVKVAN